MSERRIQSEILLAASEFGLTLWRNNTAMAWAGESQRLPDGSVLIRNPRPIHAGLCAGSSDLIGIHRVSIKEQDVGKTLAQFAAVEVKSPKGRVSPKQRHFLDYVRESGGFAIVARSPRDLKDKSTGEPS